MKNRFFKTLVYALTAVVLSAGFAACSDDEEEDNKQNEAVKAWLLDGTWSSFTANKDAISSLWKFVADGSFYQINAGIDGYSEHKGSFEVKGTNLVLTGEDGTKETLPYECQGDDRLIVTYNGNTRTYIRQKGVMTVPDLANTSYNYFRHLTKVKFNSGQEVITIPESLQFEGKDQLNLKKLSDVVADFVATLFKEIEFDASGTMSLVDMDEEKETISYTLTTAPLYGDLSYNIISLDMGTSLPPLEADIYQVDDRLFFLFKTDACITLTDILFTTAIENQTGTLATDEDKATFKARMEKAFKDYYILVAFQKG